MLFSSINFLYYFLPCVLIIYFITPAKYKNGVLLISSLLFYFYGEPIYILVMLGEILSAYIHGVLIDKYKKYKKIFLISSIIISLGTLGIFKYSDFFITNINSLLKSKISLLNLVLPIGISFYTFQILSYVIDVYKEKVPVQRNFIKLATYVSLFPQLVAGPIVRYIDVQKEITKREHTFQNMSQGITRFCIGLSKKVLIANQLGELSQIFLQTNEKSIIFYWIYGIAFSLQIYFDFSAYSDMAIGLGKMFGFHFLENFNYPYISKSITEFWRRWHISLGTWFKDYVYIPLGGNRVGKIKLVRNILVVWMLTGFWHGANWTFILWGLLFGILLIIEKTFLLEKLEKMPKFLGHIYVIFIVMISFIIFNANNIGEAIKQITGLFGSNGEELINSYTIYYLKSYFVILVLAIIGATPLLKNTVNKLKEKIKIRKIINICEPLMIVILMLFVTSYLVDSSYNPFLYFRF
ncbi:MAG: MBOAT family protein [Clostridia bacterium]|nr:MBOAT family protein [Clostridia bacterium]